MDGVYATGPPGRKKDPPADVFLFLVAGRGAEFIQPLIPRYGEIHCYIRDPDGYMIEVCRNMDLTYG